MYFAEHKYCSVMVYSWYIMLAGFASNVGINAAQHDGVFVVYNTWIMWPYMKAVKSDRYCKV
jgi:hypothetical protein